MDSVFLNARNRTFLSGLRRLVEVTFLGGGPRNAREELPPRLDSLVKSRAAVEFVAREEGIPIVLLALLSSERGCKGWSLSRSIISESALVSTPFDDPPFSFSLFDSIGAFAATLVLLA